MILSAVLMIPFHSKNDPVKAFRSECKTVEHAIKDNNAKYADECLDDLTTRYGENDTIRCYRIMNALSKHDVDNCVSLLKEFDDKESDEYRNLLMRVYAIEDLTYSEDFLEVSLEAVNKNPSDEYLLLQVGVLYVLSEKYKSSLYFLEKASDNIADNGIADYYKGVALFELGYENDAASSFLTAIDKGLTEDMRASINEYLQKVVAYE